MNGGLTQCLISTKQWLFQYMFIIDSNTVINPSLCLLITLLELFLFPYYYFHHNYEHLEAFSLIRQYQNIVKQYNILVVPFSTQPLSLLALAFYPCVMTVALVLKKFGPIKLLVIPLQITLFLYPLLFIKILIESVSCFQNGYLIYLAVPLSLASLTFGVVVLGLSKRLHRFLEIPLIISLELNGNSFAILILLGIKLLILLYLFYPRNPFILSFWSQLSLYLITLFCLFTDDQALQYTSFMIISFSFLLFGLFCTRLSFEEARNIYDKADALEEDLETAVYEVLEDIERHETECAFVTCKCHGYLECEPKNLKAFVYEFQEQRLKRKILFQERMNYAQKCIEKYEFRLSGLIRVFQYEPKSLLEEYKIMRMSQLFENNMRKQDKNCRYGEVYQTIYEEEHALSQDMLQILQMIREFWKIVVSFDGSTKFLSLILQISHAISALDHTYSQLRQKYDQEVSNFKYLFDLFRTLILNQKISEDDEVALPDSVTYLITSGTRILAANNNFATFVNRKLENIIGSSYYSYIPEIYRQPHKQWAEEFVERYEDYQEKKLFKTFSVDSLEIRVMEMSHRVLPRFLNGLEIFTQIYYPPQARKNIEEITFLFLVQKDSLFIKNVEPSFLEIIRFKVNQRNMKLLQELSLNSIFHGLNLALPSNAPRQATLVPEFAEEFTYFKKKSKKSKLNDKQHEGTLGISKIRKAEEGELVFGYEVIPNSRKEDPYVKVLFEVKGSKEEKGASEAEEEQKEIVSEDNQKSRTQLSNMDFHLPYYMLLFLIAIHILFLNIDSHFSQDFTHSMNMFDFYVGYDYTILYCLNTTLGHNQLAKLQNLWIKGFGDFPESINAFQHVQDPLFGNYFLAQVTISYHNQLYQEILDFIKQSYNTVNIYQAVLIILLVVGATILVIDFLLSLRYMFSIQSKVGQLLLQFIVVTEPDIVNLQLVIDNFIRTILNHQDQPDRNQFKVPIETVEESALQLMKCGSLNNSYIQENPDTDLVFETRRSNRRKSSIFGETDRRSLADIKNEFRQRQRKTSMTKKGVSPLDSQSAKQENVAFFKKQYGSCSFILQSNWKLFSLILLGLIISLTVLGLTFLLLNPPIAQYQTRIKLLQNLYQTKVIILKSIIELAISHYELKPRQTPSSNLLENVQLLKGVSGGQLPQYAKLYNDTLTSNTCKQLGSTLCSYNFTIAQYGLNVITQQIQEYFRQKNQSSIKVNNTQNSLILYSQIIVTQLINKYAVVAEDYHRSVQSMEVKLVVIGTFALAVGLLLSYFSLKQLKNRIEDTKALLKIVPQDIKQKHARELRALLSAG